MKEYRIIVRSNMEYENDFKLWVLDAIFISNYEKFDLKMSRMKVGDILIEKYESQYEHIIYDTIVIEWREAA